MDRRYRYRPPFPGKRLRPAIESLRHAADKKSAARYSFKESSAFLFPSDKQVCSSFSAKILSRGK